MMLSVGIVATGGVGYYLDTVGSGVDDYYLKASPGRWLGDGAARLGLTGPVVEAQVEALAAGRHPITDEDLGAARRKVTAFDLTFSAPKSVGLLAETSDPATGSEVRAAHAEAVAAAVAFTEAEGVLAGRRGHAGARHVATDGAVAAGFEHRTSRLGDPQLHTHVLLFNCALGVDGRWGGVDGRRVYGWAKTTGYVYQAALRAELTTRLGVQWRPVVNGMAELAGFTDTQLEAFSGRRAQIEQALAEVGHTSARSAQIAALATRPVKPESIDPEMQRLIWRAQAAEVGLDTDALVAALPAIPADPPLPDPVSLAEELATPSGLTAHRSAFDRRDVVRAVAESAPSGIGMDDTRAAADRVLAHPEMAATGRHSRISGPLYSTVELMAIEQDLLGRAEQQKHQQRGVCPEAAVESAIESRPGLSAEQEHMIRTLCTSGRGVEVVVGRAGTGKTFALDAAREAWVAAGYHPIGAALAARTAAGLQAGTGIPSTTVDLLLNDLSRFGPPGRLPHRSVVIVDEAGMVGTRKLAQLFEAVEQSGAKLVLVGDPRQLPEVEAGGAFAALAGNDPIQLTHNRRQELEWEKAALNELRHGDVAKAVTVYRDNQRINLADSAQHARQQLVSDWWAGRGELGADRVVMIALHQSDVDQLNQAARVLRQQSGELEGPTVEGTDSRRFAVGDEILALRNDRRIGVNNGTRATVTGVDPAAQQLDAVTENGKTVVIPADYLGDGHLTHGYAITAHKAQGMTTRRAFVLGSDRLYREAGYTALSRAVERTDLYQVNPPTSRWEPYVDPVDDLTRLLSRSGAQTLATGAGQTVDRVALRDAALADPAQHLIDRLGEPPAAGPARDAWAAAATAIDAYRQTHDITGPDPLGPRPADPDAIRQWDHAHAAAHVVERQQQIELDQHLSL